MPRLRSIIAVTILPLVVLLSACSSGTGTADGAKPAEPEVRLLFAVSGPAKIEDGKLTVNAEHIDWFTDRPARKAGRMSVQAFVDSWHGTDFETVPPNAFLVGDVSDIAVVLTTPTVEENGIGFHMGNRLNGGTADGDIGSVALFIDSKNNHGLGPM